MLAFVKLHWGLGVPWHPDIWCVLHFVVEHICIVRLLSITNELVNILVDLYRLVHVAIAIVELNIVLAWLVEGSSHSNGAT